MKKTILIGAAAVALSLTCATAQTFSEIVKIGEDNYTFYYDISNDGVNDFARITGVSPKLAGNIELPATLGVYPVKAIGDFAFSDSLEMESVVIPEGVASIGAYAFGFCGNLQEVSFPSTLAQIMDGAFQNCAALGSVSIPQSVVSIGRDAFHYTDFYNNHPGPFVVTDGWVLGYKGFVPGGRLVIPAGTRGIAVYAFDSKSLTEIVVPPSVVAIGAQAFTYNSDLKDVTLPCVPSSFDLGMFDGCPYIENVTITAGAASTVWDTEAFKSKASLRNLDIVAGVTGIGDSAFHGCSGLTNLKLPATLTTVGPSAFRNCTGLKEVEVPCASYEGSFATSSYPFTGCSAIEKVTIFSSSSSTEWTSMMFSSLANLKSVVVRGGVTSLGFNAFGNCAKLTDLDLPDSLLSIGAQAFDSSTALAAITIPDSVVTIGQSAFFKTVPWVNHANGIVLVDGWAVEWKGSPMLSGKVVLPAGTRGIANFAFYNSGVAEVVIPPGVKSIGDYAFFECVNLDNIAIPGSVKTIRGRAFLHCESLANLTLAPGLESIGDYAFSNCKKLANINIPASVRSVGDNAFASTPWWTAQDDGIVYLDGWALGGKNFIPSVHVEIKKGTRGLAKRLFHNCGDLPSVTLHPGLLHIGDEAFSQCISMTDAALPPTVLTIGDNAFYNCGSLTGTLNIPPGLEKIGYQAFYYCDNLAGALNFPASVKSIGEQAFSRCTGIAQVSVPASVETIGGKAFLGCENLISATLPCAKIGADVFRECGKLASLTLIPGATSTEWTGVLSDVKSLRDVTIANGVTAIGDGVFAGCANLESLTIPASVTKFGEAALMGCQTIIHTAFMPAATDIGRYAFWGCPELREVALPTTVQTVGDRAFGLCTALKYATLPCAAYGKGVFDYCAGLYEVNIVPGGASTTWGGALAGNPHFETLIIHDGVTRVEGGAFAGCAGIMGVVLPCAEYGRGAFDGCAKLYTAFITPGTGDGVWGGALAGLPNLSYLLISSGVKEIGEWAFMDCTSLNMVNIPDSVARVGMDAFYNTRFWDDHPAGIVYSYNWVVGFKGSAGVDLAFPGGTRGIADFAFYGCADAQNAVIHESVQFIGDFAFYACANLTNATVNTTTAAWGDWVFGGCAKLESVVFAGNAPFAEISDWYWGTPLAMTTWVQPGSTDWGDVPGYWCGRPIEYLETAGCPRTANGIPHWWLDKHFYNGATPLDYEKLSNTGGGGTANRVSVLDSWIAWLDPNDAASVFYVKIEMVNGEAVLSCHPYKPKTRNYIELGKASLDDSGPWLERESDSRFFKMKVELK